MVLIFWSFKHNYIRIRYIHCLALNCLILIHMYTYMDMLLIVWSRMYTCRHTHCHVFGRPISCIYLYVYTMLLPCVYIYLYITVTALSCPCISIYDSCHRFSIYRWCALFDHMHIVELFYLMSFHTYIYWSIYMYQSLSVLQYSRSDSYICIMSLRTYYCFCHMSLLTVINSAIWAYCLVTVPAYIYLLAPILLSSLSIRFSIPYLLVAVATLWILCILLLN